MNGDTLVIPDVFRMLSGVMAAMSTREHPKAKGRFGFNLSRNIGDDPESVRANRGLFFEELGWTESRTAFAGQCHSDAVHRVQEPGFHPDGDAMFTDRPGIGLAVSVADCVPVLLADAAASCIASVHAGWKGSSLGISRKTVEIVVRDLGCRPEALRAFIGPSAGPCCYEVGREVSSLFRAQVVQRTTSRTTLDLREENFQQLLECGIPAGSVEVDGRCTICDTSFHSYRRDRERSGRMLAFIGLRPEKD